MLNRFQNNRQFILLLIGFFVIQIGYAQNHKQEVFIEVSGEVRQSLKISAADLSKMEHQTASLTDRDGRVHRYRGVPLTLLLDSAGVSMKGELRGENLTKYLLVKCLDGYEVLFSLAELDQDFGDLEVILADQMDGKPLPAGKGPFRLVVPKDKALARSCYEVSALIVGFATD